MAGISEEYIVHKSIRVDAGVADVWNAVTAPEKIREWLVNCTEVDVSWEIGTPIIYSGDLGHMEYRIAGTVLGYEHGRMLRYGYWSTFSRLPDLPENHSIVSISVRADGDGTILTVQQERFTGEDDYRHVNFHWEMTLRTIKKLVEGTIPATPNQLNNARV